jgi:hypothetical protein
MTHAIRSPDRADFEGSSRYPACEFASSKKSSRRPAVQSLRAIVRTPHVRGVLERGNDTALCFVLRAVDRILSDDDQPDRMTISQLWDVLDKSEFNRVPRVQRMKKPPAR